MRHSHGVTDEIEQIFIPCHRIELFKFIKIVQCRPTTNEILIHSFIHSFILNIYIIYSASSRKLLRSAPNTSTVKQSSLIVRKNAVHYFGSDKQSRFKDFGGPRHKP